MVIYSLTFRIGVDVPLLVDVPHLWAGHDFHLSSTSPNPQGELDVLCPPDLCGIWCYLIYFHVFRQNLPPSLDHRFPGEGTTLCLLQRVPLQLPGSWSCKLSPGVFGCDPAGATIPRKTPGASWSRLTRNKRINNCQRKLKPRFILPRRKVDTGSKL